MLEALNFAAVICSELPLRTSLTKERYTYSCQNTNVESTWPAISKLRIVTEMVSQLLHVGNMRDMVVF